MIRFGKSKCSRQPRASRLRVLDCKQLSSTRSRDHLVFVQILSWNVVLGDFMCISLVSSSSVPRHPQPPPPQRHFLLRAIHRRFPSPPARTGTNLLRLRTDELKLPLPSWKAIWSKELPACMIGKRYPTHRSHPYLRRVSLSRGSAHNIRLLRFQVLLPRCLEGFVLF